MNRRPKIKDIAKALGVSPATVSRALSGSDLVTSETRARVRKTADALNYRPNASARSLRTARSMAVLMVVRDVGNPFYLDILKSVEATARAAGYSVLMGNTENDPEREIEYFDMLRDGHADGMILMTGKLPEEDGPRNRLPPNAPIVVALETIEGSGFPHVQIDNVAAACEAVEHLIGLGHRRIAHISGPVPEVMSLRRQEATAVPCAMPGLPYRRPTSSAATIFFTVVRAPARRFLSCPNRPPRSSSRMTKWPSAPFTICARRDVMCRATFLLSGLTIFI